MNVFEEFLRIVAFLRDAQVDYALIGGVAMAFHAEPRFTRDIDVLIRADDLERVSDLLIQAGYFASTRPWAFTNSHLTLHRFLKAQGSDSMLVDILVAGDDQCEAVIRDAMVAESPKTGPVRVADKDGLIFLKRKRNSKQDQADIERLTDEGT